MVRIDMKEECCCRIKVTAPLFYYGMNQFSIVMLRLEYGCTRMDGTQFHPDCAWKRSS